MTSPAQEVLPVSGKHGKVVSAVLRRWCLTGRPGRTHSIHDAPAGHIYSKWNRDLQRNCIWRFTCNGHWSHDTSRPVSRVLSANAAWCLFAGWPFIWDARCRAPRAANPGSVPENANRKAWTLHAAPIWPCSRWGLPCRPRCRVRGALLPHPFTLTPVPRHKGGLLSVALSLESPPPDVIRHRVSVEPGLSSPAPETGNRRGHPAGWCHDWSYIMQREDKSNPEALQPP